jgi:hypothetical protein
MEGPMKGKMMKDVAPTKQTRTRLAAGLLAVSFFGLSACGGSYDREETITDLMEESGIDRETSTCIVDGMEEKIGVDRLDDRGNPTEEEEQIMLEIATDCLTGG